MEYDTLDLVTEDLRRKLEPANRQLRLYEKERAERRKVRKRTKSAQPVKDKEEDVQMDQAAAPHAEQPSAGGVVQGGELEDEVIYRKRELKELESLVDVDVKADVGCSPTGLYDLVG